MAELKKYKCKCGKSFLAVGGKCGHSKLCYSCIKKNSEERKKKRRLMKTPKTKLQPNIWFKQTIVLSPLRFC